VIVIDDDDIMLLSCSEILSRVGYTVETFSSGEEGIQRIETTPAPILVVDLKMPKIDGMEVIRRVRQIDPAMVIVVITGYATIATAVDAMKAGAYDFLPKPFTPEELRLIVNRSFERWHLAQESERLRQEKEQVQRRFVTFVSHQLKTPLVAAKQYLDVLLYSSHDELPERAQEWIQRCQLRIGEMLAIIQDWLDLSRIERGDLCRHDEGTDLDEVLDSVLQAMEPQASEADVTLASVRAPDLPPVRGDRVSLAMLLSNLVSNAIKYNRRGGSATVRTAREGDRAVVEVIDTGIGIAGASLEHLFQEFYRVKSELTREIPGTGLGLAICHRIVSELGGTIEVDSTEGKGTTFVVRLLLGQPQSPAPSAE
jgi:signal transduction histidine kinase